MKIRIPRNWRKNLLLLEVVWTDSRLSTGGWERHDDTMAGRGRIFQRSVGYILADDKHGIMLAGSLSQGGNVHGVVTIPASQIVSKRRLT